MPQKTSFRFLFLFATSLLAAADPQWGAKSVAEWTDSDGVQVLSNSPYERQPRSCLVLHLHCESRA